ncbi:Manganese transport system membrane protein MntB [bioreactor metagenome]|uniref:Manganese transport system membrane protein MntB n=1 Tax=bioreactor metagenome TaxID=1076179 RepID=A0A645DII9_9ZZZZ
MIDVIREMLSYPFLVRALTVGLLVALCASLLGVSLVLKRFSMIGDGLSHVGFGALAIASVAGIAPLYLAIPVCIAASFLLLRMSESTRIKGDAAIAMLSAGALAIGVMVVSMTTGMNTDVYNYMFGSILSLSQGDATLSIVLSLVVLVLFVLFYPRLFAVTFDETFSRATGIPTRAYNAALATLSSVTVVLGMRMMGALLISSLIIFPILTAMRVGKRYLTVTILSAIVALLGFLLGMYVSYVYEAPSGASIVCINIVLFLLFALVGAVRNAVVKR